MRGSLICLKRRAKPCSKAAKVGPQGQGKEIDAQFAPKTWFPAPMLHGEPLMEDASLRDFRGHEGTYVADALERSLLLPTDIKELKSMRRQEVFLSMKRYLAMVRLLILVTTSISHSWCVCSDWQAVQATYRLEDDSKEQSRSMKIERNKHLDAARTLKNFEDDFAKAREDLKEMTRQRDSAEASLSGAQTQAEAQMKRLLEVEDQLGIAKEQIVDLRKRLTEAD